MSNELDQINNDNTALIQQLEELTTVINSQVELEQQDREEKLEIEKEQQLKQEEEQLLQIEQQEMNESIQQLQLEETTAFRESLLKSLSEINENLVELTSVTTASVEMQKDTYNEVLPAVKQSSEWTIIFLGLIPLFLVVRWIGQMFDGSFR